MKTYVIRITWLKLSSNVWVKVLTLSANLENYLTHEEAICGFVIEILIPLTLKQPGGLEAPTLAQSEILSINSDSPEILLIAYLLTEITNK